MDASWEVLRGWGWGLEGQTALCKFGGQGPDPGARLGLWREELWKGPGRVRQCELGCGLRCGAALQVSGAEVSAAMAWRDWRLSP